MMARSSSASLVVLLAPLLLLSTGSRAAAEHHQLFCPKTVFYKPKPPHIHYKCICPQRICPDCPLPNFGYYPTIYRPWPFPTVGTVMPVSKTEPSKQGATPPSSEPLPQPAKMPQEPTLP